MQDDLKSSLDKLHVKQDEQTAKLNTLMIQSATQGLDLTTQQSQSEKTGIELSALNTNLQHLNIILVRQESNLQEHMRRTDLLEKTIIPIHKHVILVNGFFKIATSLFALAAAIATVIKYFK